MASRAKSATSNARTKAHRAKSATSNGRTKAHRAYAPRMAPEERRGQLLDAALSVIVEQGYSRVSVEAVARAAGVTRPVIYDHFANLASLLHALIEREERYSVDLLERLIPKQPNRDGPLDALADSVGRFLDAVAGKPATWTLILLPLEGTPDIVRQHVASNRLQILRRIEDIVRWGIDRTGLPDDFDIELTARAILGLAEDAGRMVLTDRKRSSPGRYAEFVRPVMTLLIPARAA
jgi:AcrR family transcriptional regulator